MPNSSDTPIYITDALIAEDQAQRLAGLADG